MKIDREIYKELLYISKLESCQQRLQEYLKELKPQSYRTLPQNSAMRLYARLCSDELNNAGYTVQLVLKEKVDVDWTPDLFFEIIWRNAQIAITGKKSSTELSKLEEIDLIYEHVNRHLGEKFGIHVPFPSEDKSSYRK